MQNDNETLSAIVDGEFRSLDRQNVTDIAANADSRAAWARYHLIGDVMRDNLTGVAPTRFSEALRAEIEREPTRLPQHRSGRTWQTPVAGFALAASVAALAVFGIKQLGPAPTQRGSDVVATSSATPAPSAASIPQVSVAQAQPLAESPDTLLVPVPGSVDTHRRLNGYLVKFNEQRSSLGVPGVNPYVRIVGFESE